MTGDILRLIHFVSFRKQFIEHAILHCNGLEMGLDWVTLHVDVSYFRSIGSREGGSRFERLLCERCVSFTTTFSGIKVWHRNRFTSLEHCLWLRLSALVDRRNAIGMLCHTKLWLGHISVVGISISLHGSLQRHSLLVVNSTDLFWESLHYSFIIILFFIQFMLINTCFGVQPVFKQVCLSIELSIDIGSLMKVSLDKCILQVCTIFSCSSNSRLISVLLDNCLMLRVNWVLQISEQVRLSDSLLFYLTLPISSCVHAGSSSMTEWSSHDTTLSILFPRFYICNLILGEYSSSVLIDVFTILLTIQSLLIVIGGWNNISGFYFINNF